MGRGRHYDQKHLEALQKIRELQSAGYSLEAIGQIFAGRKPQQVPPPTAAAPARPVMSAELWTRLKVGRGIEVSFDASRHQPTAEQLVELREAIARIMNGDGSERA